MLTALQSVGGLNGLTIALVVAMAVLINLIADELSDVAGALVDGGLKQWFPCAEWIVFGMKMPIGAVALLALTAVTLLVLIVALLRAGKGYLADERPRVISESPAPATAIVMFLSMPNLKGLAPDGISVESYSALVEALGRRIRLDTRSLNRSAQDGDNSPTSMSQTWKIDEDRAEGAPATGVLANLFANRRFNWRMNIEALGPHIGTTSPLRHVVIVPSSVGFDGGTLSEGSAQWLPLAQGMLRGVLESHGMGAVNVSGCDALEGQRGTLPDRVPYDDLEAVVDLLYDVTSALRGRYRCREKDVLVDITSGKGLCNAAGLAFATLVDDRRVQYVDTETYRVWTFDVTHDIEK